MWEGVCGSRGAGEREREEERPKERSLGGDTHEWIKRALLLHKHRGMTGALHMEKAQTRKFKDVSLCRFTHGHRDALLETS